MDKFKFYDVVIYADRGSSGARRLATAIGARRWRSDLPERYTRRRPYFRGNTSPLVVNWGSSIHPRWLEDRRLQITPNILNHGDHVAEAIDKLAFFRKASGIDGVPLLKWTTDPDVAKGWIGKGNSVVCRRSLRGSSGQGISLATTVDGLVEAPLYTRHYPKTHEFRIHVFGDKAIDLTEKKFSGDKSVRSENAFIRSHSSGWVHAHMGICLSEECRGKIERASCDLVRGLGLHFGAVDCLAILEPPAEDGSRKLKNFVLCEVNTGPGLENTKTIEAYSNEILNIRNAPTIQAESV